MPDLDLGPLLIDLLATTPGITHERVSGRFSFMTGGKVFVFARPSQLSLKLPAATIAKLVAEDRATPLTLGKRTMKEWAVITRPTLVEYAHELPLILAAKHFVESEAAKPNPKPPSTKRKPTSPRPELSSNSPQKGTPRL